MKKRTSSRKRPERPDRSQDDAPPRPAAVHSHPLDGVKVALTYKNEVQKKMGKLIAEKEIVVCAGSPGTGKTIVACAEALVLLKKHPELYRSIVMVKSVTNLQEEDLGYMKGTMDEKMEPHLYSFISNMTKLVGAAVVRRMREEGYLTVLPIAFMRGVNMDNCIVLVDEAQNILLQNMRTILTRIGTDCKMVILGDTEQSDMKRRSESALAAVVDMFSDGSVPGMGVVQFGDEHIVRNPIIAHVEAAFRARAGS